MTVDVTVGCKRYPWVEPLAKGTVEPSGADLTIVDGRVSPEYFVGMLRRGEFDVAELCIGSYLASRERDVEHDVTAIPVFPHRRFRHAFVYVRSDSDLASPADLDGRTVGLPYWQFATGLWMCGILAERHGLDLTSVTWKRSASEIVPLELSDAITISDMESGQGRPTTAAGETETVEEGGTGALKTLERGLVDGTLDAVISPTEFRTDAVERLFADPFDRERAYFEETGIFPIMHVLAVRDDLIKEHPWLPDAMYEAFDEALRETFAEVTEPGWFKRSALVWGLESIEEQLARFDRNPWEYGLTEYNTRTLEKAVQYARQQEIIETTYPVGELFVDGVGDADP